MSPLLTISICFWEKWSYIFIKIQTTFLHLNKLGRPKECINLWETDTKFPCLSSNNKGWQYLRHLVVSAACLIYCDECSTMRTYTIIIGNDYLDWIVNKILYMSIMRIPLKMKILKLSYFFNTSICTSLTALGHKERMLSNLLSTLEINYHLNSFFPQRLLAL